MVPTSELDHPSRAILASHADSSFGSRAPPMCPPSLLGILRFGLPDYSAPRFLVVRVIKDDVHAHLVSKCPSMPIVAHRRVRREHRVVGGPQHRFPLVGAPGMIAIRHCMMILLIAIEDRVLLLSAVVGRYETPQGAREAPPVLRFECAGAGVYRVRTPGAQGAHKPER